MVMFTVRFRVEVRVIFPAVCEMKRFQTAKVTLRLEGDSKSPPVVSFHKPYTFPIAKYISILHCFRDISYFPK